MSGAYDFTVATPGRGFVEITPRVAECLSRAKIDTGLCNIFIAHTSASLMICENADPAVLTDMAAFAERFAPDGADYFTHTAEGADDMSAHIRSVFTTSSLSVPVRAGRLALGTWQGIFVWEHRYAAHQRKVFVTAVA